MTEGILPETPDNYRTIGYNPVNGGCTHDGCGVQDTVVLTGHHGRRCADHVPPFDPAVAAELATVDLGAAFDYVRGTWGRA